MLPTWRFSYEEAESFLLDYGHITGPIIEELETQHLVLFSYGKLRLTEEGMMLRRVWAQEDNCKDCTRMREWPYKEDPFISEKELRISISMGLLEMEAIRRRLEHQLLEVQNVASVLTPEAFAWHIQEALAQWCDGEETAFEEEDMTTLLKSVAPRKLAMLIRARNGSPNIPALRIHPIGMKPLNVVPFTKSN